VQAVSGEGEAVGGLEGRPCASLSTSAKVAETESRLSVHSCGPLTPSRRGADAPQWRWLRPGARGPVCGRGRPGVSETWLRGESARSHLMRLRGAGVASPDAAHERKSEEQVEQVKPPLILPCDSARRPPDGATQTTVQATRTNPGKQLSN
jgi:hypothetical protein